jgi:hypothetical protein
MAVSGGQIAFVREDVARTPDDEGPTIERSHNMDWSAEWWFGVRRVGLFGPPTITMWHAPLWPFVLLTGVPGAWLLVKTRKRGGANACAGCGYDRTGLPTANAVCPECGAGTGGA